MQSFTLLSLLYATSALALPNPIALLNPHEAAKRDVLFSSPLPDAPTLSLPTISTTTLITITTTVTATPSSKPASSTSSRPSSTLKVSASPTPISKAGVYICSDVNWTGTCTHHLTPLGSGPDACTQLDGSASSIGPDPGFICEFYTNAFCDPVLSDASDRIELAYPGVPNLLVTSKGNFNDKIRSYSCLLEG